MHTYLERTDERTLEPLRGRFPAVDALLRYRAAAKVVNTYGAKFLQHRSPDGRLRGDWQQIGTERGRMACTRPAVQTLPKTFRQAVVAAPGHVLLTADYSTMELRIAATLAGEQRMLDAFAQGRDLHADTAQYVFQLRSPDEVRAEYRPGLSYRDAGKKLNFSLLYGASAYGIARQLDIEPEEAECLLERFHRLYPALTRWNTRVREQGLREGFTSTQLGRRRFYPPVDEGDWKARQQVLREAGNARVQGCGADITKQAIRLFAEEVPPRDGHLVLVLHDELVVECREELSEQVADALKRAMYEAGVWAGVPLPEPEVCIASHWTK